MARQTTQQRLAWERSGAGEGMDILNSRRDGAERALTRLVPKLSDEDLFEIANEIGLDLCLSYNKHMTGILFDLTDLQLVAFTAAVAAREEYLHRG